MKTKFDPRHLRRIKDMQSLFALASNPNSPSTDNAQKISQNLTSIDNLISTHAPKWPLDKINKVDLAILRLAVWEMQNSPDTPPKVIIDEAVEMAKEFGTEQSSAFINGVLGGILKQR